MPNDTSFAVQYRKLIDHNFEADAAALARTRSNLIAQISAHSPPSQTNRLWTKTKEYDTIHSENKTGEEEK